MSRLVVAMTIVAALAGRARADDTDLGQTQPPRASSVTIGAGTALRWYHDTSAAALSPKAMFGPRFDVGWRIVHLGGPRGGFVLWLAADVGGGTSDGQIFQSLDTHIAQQTFTAGPRLELELWGGVSTQAQFDLGAARTHVTIGETANDMAPVDDTVWHAIGSASVGVGYKATRRRYSLALFVDLGWTVTQSANIHANPQSHPDPDLAIDTTYASLGHLDTGGLTLSTTMRFGF